MIADVVLGLQHGDEAKGKITHQLCSKGNYTHVIRFNGGCNAGHTIYHEGKKFVTHHIPAGVFYGIESIIGPGCVVDPDQFFKEINELEEAGIPAADLVSIAETPTLSQKNIKKRMARIPRLEQLSVAMVLLIVINMTGKVLGQKI